MLERAARKWVLTEPEEMDPRYEVLEGTPYSRYALPIEYMPSRDFQPRWGNTRPPIPMLQEV